MEHIGAQDLYQLLSNRDTSIRLIDVREKDEYAICSISGAELLPLSDFLELVQQLLVDKEENLVLYCHHGMRSRKAARWLSSQGYLHVFYLAGGIDSWAVSVDLKMPRY